MSENGRVATNEIFGPGADGRAVPRTAVAGLAALVRAGLDPALLDRAAGWWDQATRPGPGWVTGLDNREAPTGRTA